MWFLLSVRQRPASLAGAQAFRKNPSLDGSEMRSRDTGRYASGYVFPALEARWTMQAQLKSEESYVGIPKAFKSYYYYSTAIVLVTCIPPIGFSQSPVNSISSSDTRVTTAAVDGVETPGIATPLSLSCCLVYVRREPDFLLIPVPWFRWLDRTENGRWPMHIA